ncbi:hypothetical protein [Qiania dongpingensis]|uniref:Uncharacterized protein n=1 Tax=Qiania dongpingensis TaxID=2763669 RepID=A0A7G9G714_9FIRM|nr:hypothetical protein [Qiania dongpingensis]QNM06596.1 hypothetical protein H9Q78_05540 [Qiania dongpingensis]
MYQYRCDQCGCYLDPEEGETCEECRAESRKRTRDAAALRMELYGEPDGRQIGGQDERYLTYLNGTI